MPDASGMNRRIARLEAADADGGAATSMMRDLLRGLSLDDLRILAEPARAGLQGRDAAEDANDLADELMARLVSADARWAEFGAASGVAAP